MAKANSITVKGILCSMVSLGLVMPLSVEQVATAMPQTPGQINPIHVAVDLVQLNVAVTDSKGNYVTGLKPADFTVLEDGIPQMVATFGEGNEAARKLAEGPKNPESNATEAAEGAPQEPGKGTLVSSAGLSSIVAGANVFVLFDTSNYMYRGFVFAQDAISDFIRSLDSADRIAFFREPPN
jgi:Ca-activated chloride channel homolog